MKEVEAGAMKMGSAAAKQRIERTVTGYYQNDFSEHDCELAFGLTDGSQVSMARSYFSVNGEVDDPKSSYRKA